MESRRTRQMEYSSLINLTNEIQLKIFDCLKLEDQYNFYVYLKKYNNMDFLNKHLKIKLTKQNVSKLIYNIKRRNINYIEFLYLFTKKKEKEIILKHLFVFGDENLYLPFMDKYKVILSPTLYICLYNNCKRKTRQRTLDYLRYKNRVFYRLIN